MSASGVLKLPATVRSGTASNSVAPWVVLRPQWPHPCPQGLFHAARRCSARHFHRLWGNDCLDTPSHSVPSTCSWCGGFQLQDLQLTGNCAHTILSLHVASVSSLFGPMLCGCPNSLQLAGLTPPLSDHISTAAEVLRQVAGSSITAQ